MARKKHNIHYIYKTTCNVTGRYYVGMHSTSNEEDGYLGSGKRLRHSIRKYGKDNHTKEILEYFDSRELLIEAEKGAITPDMIDDNNCMNLCKGGEGGFISLEGVKKGRQTTNEKHKDKLTEWSSKGGKAKFEKHGLPDNFKYDWTGKSRSTEFKKQISEIKKGTGIGETNSQYGTCWITKEGVNKKIKKEELDNWILEGWVKGRMLK